MFSIKSKRIETLRIQIDRNKIKALKQFLKAFDIPFEKEESKPYKKEFVERVLLADKELEEGKGVKIAIDDLWK